MPRKKPTVDWRVSEAAQRMRDGYCHLQEALAVMKQKPAPANYDAVERVLYRAWVDIGDARVRLQEFRQKGPTK